MKSKKQYFWLIITLNLLISIIPINANTQQIQATYVKYVNLNGNGEVDAYFAGNGTNGLSIENAYTLSNLQFNTTPASSIYISITNSDRYINITKISINDTSNTNNNGIGILLDNASNINIFDCEFISINTAIKISSLENISVFDNSFLEKIDEGIFLSDSVSNIIVADNIIDTYEYTYFLDINVEVNNLLFYDNTQLFPIISQMIYGRIINNASIYNNTLLSSYDSLIYVNTGYNVNIYNNKITSIKNEVIDFSKVTNSTITKNTLIRSGDSIRSQVIVRSGSDHIYVAENYITTNSGYGISLSGDSSTTVQNTTVVGNYFINSPNGIRLYYAINNLIYNNSFFNITTPVIREYVYGSNTWYAKSTNYYYGNYYQQYNTKYPNAIVNASNPVSWNISYVFKDSEPLYNDPYPLIHPIKDQMPTVHFNISAGADLLPEQKIKITINDFVSINGTYNISFDNVLLQKGNWTQSKSITLPLTTYKFGIHQIIINVSDGLNEIQQSSIYFQIKDTLAPIIFVNGTTSIFVNTKTVLNWTIQDMTFNTNASIILYINNSAYSTQLLQSTTQTLFVTVNTNKIGETNYTLVVNDGWGNKVSKSVIISVVNIPTSTETITNSTTSTATTSTTNSPPPNSPDDNNTLLIIIIIGIIVIISIATFRYFKFKAKKT